jgi:hypothetical protein
MAATKQSRRPHDFPAKRMHLPRKALGRSEKTFLAYSQLTGFQRFIERWAFVENISI